MADVILDKVSKIYDNGVRAVNGATLTISDKEFVIFVGPSGCGKSTLLRIIAGLENLTDGRLYIGGELMNNVHPRDRDIAMVFQNYALYPHMTVYDNMGFSLKLKEETTMEIEKRVLDAAQKLGLSDYLHRLPKTLSGGQRQRVALGRAIVRKPKVFLFDEPLSNLDAKFRTSMRSEIIDMHKRLQTTFIYVTHDQLEAMTMGTKIVIINDGMIQQADAPQTVYDFPANVFVARFIGLPQMNMLKAVLENSQTGFNINVAGKSVPVHEATANRIKRVYEKGGGILLGIRAEDLKPCPQENAVFGGEICLAENLGNEILVYADTDASNESLIFRSHSRALFSRGEKIGLTFDTQRIHMFDPLTGQTMLDRAPRRTSEH